MGCLLYPVEEMGQRRCRVRRLWILRPLRGELVRRHNGVTNGLFEGIRADQARIDRAGIPRIGSKVGPPDSRRELAPAAQVSDELPRQLEAAPFELNSRGGHGRMLTLSRGDSRLIGAGSASARLRGYVSCGGIDVHEGQIPISRHSVRTEEAPKVEESGYDGPIVGWPESIS